ncbi:MAG: alpha/beta hydrolase [Planctomycetaceae bacterium]|nr:alpha/beta hydrolase [Planctomycetaceae bacterium]
MKHPLSLAVFLLLTGCMPLWAADPVQITPDVVYGHKDGMALTFDVFRPSENARGIGLLFMVSGGWYSGWQPPEQMLGMFKPLLDRGFTAFAVRHGSAPRYKVPEAIDDVRRAVRFIRAHAADYGVDPERLGVFGMSAGGHLSMMLATTGDEGDPNAKDAALRGSSRIAAAVAYFGPTDLRPWVTGPDSGMRDQFTALQFDAGLADDCSPLLQVTGDDAPTLLIHGDKDELVPIDHSHTILKAMQEAGAPCELLTIEGAGHGFPGEGGRRAMEALVDWFEKYLGKK